MGHEGDRAVRQGLDPGDPMRLLGRLAEVVFERGFLDDVEFLVVLDQRRDDPGVGITFDLDPGHINVPSCVGDQVP